MKKILLALLFSVGLASLAQAKPLHLILAPSFACQSIAHAPKCHVINVNGYEVATTLTIPNTFTSGTVISSSQMNTNFSSIQSWSSTIDTSNIGSTGIKPAQIKCSTTPDCTFGSAQTYFFNPANTGIVPLTVTNASAPSADYLDVTSNGASAGNVANIDSNGNLHTQGIIYAAPTATPTASANWCQNDNQATNGLTCNMPTGSTRGFRYFRNGPGGTLLYQLTAAGNVAITGTATATVDSIGGIHLVGVATAANTDGGATGYLQTIGVQQADASTCHTGNVCVSKSFTTNAAGTQDGCGVADGTSPSRAVIAFMSGSAGSYTMYWLNETGGDLLAQTYFANVVCAGY